MNAPPKKKETLGAVQGAEGLEENTENDTIVIGADAERKTVATLQARLALRGVTLQRLPSGDYLAHAWNYSKTLPDVQGIEAFAERVGA